MIFLKQWVAHAFIPSTLEAEAGDALCEFEATQHNKL